MTRRLDNRFFDLCKYQIPDVFKMVVEGMKKGSIDGILFILE